MRTGILLVALLAFNGAVVAQDTNAPGGIPSAKDVPYSGTIRLDVDATDTIRHIFRVHEIIPVTPGSSVTLFYPRWLPGNHSPSGRIEQLTGLSLRAGGARLDWTRDPVDVYAFHVQVPNGVSALDADFQVATATDGDQGRMVITPDMLNLEWNEVALYPAGFYARQINIQPAVRLPAGWQFATALETQSSGAVTAFKTTDLDTLVDSPLFAGRNFRRVQLSSAPVPVFLNIMADTPDELAFKPEQIELHRNLVSQAYKLFGSHHYDHYDFLLALTDTMGGIGLEHQRSSENGTVPTFFTEWDKNADTRDLLPHEFTHSWNGKFRRPADLWTSNFNIPMRDSLLWVYEGQTQYWGYVLAARSGLLTKQQALDAIAATAAAYDNRKGREWRPLADTTNDPIIAMRRPLPWRSWQRAEDYYSEGELIWLDADTLIRQISGGKKSLDDFAKAFFGIDDGSYREATYSFDDVAKTLNAVAPHDWATFLHQRLDAIGEGAPLDGITRGGYRLIYNDTPSDFSKAAETRRKVTDLTYSLGLIVGREAKLTDVLWEGPAFQAGLTVGTQIIAVNGVAYDADKLKTVVKNSAMTTAPIEFIVKNGDRYRTLKIDYHGGSRYPHLQASGGPQLLDIILTAK